MDRRRARAVRRRRLRDFPDRSAHRLRCWQQNVEPLLGILFAMALLGERLSAWQWCGVALVVAGLALFELPARHKRG